MRYLTKQFQKDYVHSKSPRRSNRKNDEIVSRYCIHVECIFHDDKYLKRIKFHWILHADRARDYPNIDNGDSQHCTISGQLRMTRNGGAIREERRHAISSHHSLDTDTQYIHNFYCGNAINSSQCSYMRYRGKKIANLRNFEIHITGSSVLD